MPARPARLVSTCSTVNNNTFSYSVQSDVAFAHSKGSLLESRGGGESVRQAKSLSSFGGKLRRESSSLQKRWWSASRRAWTSLAKSASQRFATGTTTTGAGALSSSSSSSVLLSPSSGGTKPAFLGSRALSEPNLKVDEFERVSVLGEGTYGKIYLVRRKATGEIFAQKVMKRRKSGGLKAEMKILASIVHPFVVRCRHVCDHANGISIVMDYAANGTMRDVLKTCPGRKVGEAGGRDAAAELASAVLHLHSAAIVHRDIKPSNILIDGDGHCLLSDFGLAAVCDTSANKLQRFCGTVEYCAPELLRGDKYGVAVDWWAVGCVVHELVAGESPFGGRSGVRQLFSNILRVEPTFDRVPPNARPFVRALLLKDAELRLGTTDAYKSICGHDYFAGTVDWVAVGNREAPSPFAANLVQHLKEQGAKKKKLMRPKAPTSAPEASINTSPSVGFAYRATISVKGEPAPPPPLRKGVPGTEAQPLPLVPPARRTSATAPPPTPPPPPPFKNHHHQKKKKKAPASKEKEKEKEEEEEAAEHKPPSTTTKDLLPPAWNRTVGAMMVSGGVIGDSAIRAKEKDPRRVTVVTTMPTSKTEATSEASEKAKASPLPLSRAAEFAPTPKAAKKTLTKATPPRRDDGGVEGGAEKNAARRVRKQAPARAPAPNNNNNNNNKEEAPPLLSPPPRPSPLRAIADDAEAPSYRRYRPAVRAAARDDKDESVDVDLDVLGASTYHWHEIIEAPAAPSRRRASFAEAGDRSSSAAARRAAAASSVPDEEKDSSRGISVSVSLETSLEDSDDVPLSKPTSTKRQTSSRRAPTEAPRALTALHPSL